MYQKLDSTLHLWFRQQRQKGIPVTGPILQEKATELYKLIYADSLTHVMVFNGTFVNTLESKTLPYQKKVKCRCYFR